MKTDRRGMVITGWALTVVGTGIVLAWLAIESASTFAAAPIQTLIGIVLVLTLLILLVPVPLLLATRRARGARRPAR